MFDKWKIKEHMEVTGKNGQHFGTVDEIDGDRIKLTKSDSDDNRHHFIDADMIDKVDDNRVYLKVDAPAAEQMKV